MNPTSRILGVGTAVPSTSYSQEELLDSFGITDPRVRSLFLNGAIERRNLTLPPHTADRLTEETQRQLLEKHRTAGTELGRDALLVCLRKIGATPADIRHLCCVTSTGFLTPGLAAWLVHDLPLDRHCYRLDVVGMGCNAGLNALAAVNAWSRAHPGELAVLVCVEVSSAAYLHDGTLRSAVVNSLFGDGAAAAAVMTRPDQENASAPSILGFSSMMIPEAIHAMRYDWDDSHGKFSFYLDPMIPYVIGAHAEPSVTRLLDEFDLRRHDIAHWIVHSGGKKVIDSIRVNLGLTRHDLRHTTGVLRNHGNLSSGSFLFSLDRLREENTVTTGEFGVMMTMGPGTSIEMALIQW
ncbi:3,5-dihydroxyphenylacetyl-CoA synthase DpgA [Nocardia sp. NPDC049149]|uniref:3,5-dihydroxyphenylacetyl-CoA synthase DpgA n=1 Tax=Nocardia sp. NPDC049149 TaxID=3364315 RepID=UPI00371A79B0